MRSGGTSRLRGLARRPGLVASPLVLSAAVAVAGLGPVEPVEPTAPPGSTTIPSTSRVEPAVSPSVTDPGPGGSSGCAPPTHVPGLQVAVEIEDGLGLDADCVVEEIAGILADARGWSSAGVTISVTDDDEAADLVVRLASPDSVDAACFPLRTGGRLSCAADGVAHLNVERWLEGVEHVDDLDVYRAYLVNHEVGHLLGFGHVACPGSGRPAPVMMQQTKSLDGCVANGWVDPLAAAPAAG